MTSAIAELLASCSNGSIRFLIGILLVGLCVFLFVWVLGIVGIVIPHTVVLIIYAIPAGLSSAPGYSSGATEIIFVFAIGAGTGIPNRFAKALRPTF